MQNKLPIFTQARLTMRGYKLLWQKCRGAIISSVASAAVDGLSPFVSIFIAARLIDEIAGERDPRALWGYVIAALVSAAVLSFANAALSRWSSSQENVTHYKRNRIYTDKLLELDYKHIDNPRTHSMLSDIQQYEGMNGWGLAKLLEVLQPIANAMFTIAGAIALTVALFTQPVPESGGWLTILNHPLFILLIGAVMLVITIVSPMISTKSETYWTIIRDLYRQGYREQFFYGKMGYDNDRALDIRMYRQDIYTNFVNGKDDAPGRHGPNSPAGKFTRGPMGGYRALSSALLQVFTGVAYLFVCLKAWGGAFGVGAVTLYIGALSRLSDGLSTFIATAGTLRVNSVYLQTVFDFMDLPNDMYQGTLTPPRGDDLEIEFKNVSFKYSTEYVLKNISMKFKAGQRLAVVGMNGSGKTTFIKLLCRLFDPDEGEVLLNGINIREYDYRRYMDIFSVVFQDYGLLAYELGQNVAVSKCFDTSKVTDCLTAAGFGDKLAEMTLSTCLYKEYDEHGIDVSGGEAQKIALARALHKDAAFLILDEPTAALDPVSEFEIYSRMNEISGNKNCVFISHRLSSCRFCHDIVVFHQGEIVQRGSHEELVADASGKYFELWNAQAQYYSCFARKCEIN